MRTTLKRMIDSSKSLDELHQAWREIVKHKMYEDDILMAWYDLKYNLIGNI